MEENRNIGKYGWIVKSIGPLKTNKYSQGHVLSGTREYYPEITFPICPACNYKNSPIIQVDFSDIRLNSLNLWNNNVICIQCHNGCCIKGNKYWWDYCNSYSPKIINGNLIEKIPGRIPKNWDFEGVEIELIERKNINANIIESETRIGGEPAWIHNPRNENTNVYCLKCHKPMIMIFQWSETNMNYLPKGINETAGTIMGNPGGSYWFGCKECRVMAQIIEFG